MIWTSSMCLKKEEETNVFQQNLMKKHEDNKVKNLTSYFTYHKIFLICKKLNTESSKLKNIISVSKLIIFSLEKK